MSDLSAGAKKLMDHLGTEQYRCGDYLAASRLYYLFDDEAEKNKCTEELIAHGLIFVAPNGAIGVTKEGEAWNERASA